MRLLLPGATGERRPEETRRQGVQRKMSLPGKRLSDISRLVERERELTALEAAFAEVSAGRGRVALVTAEAGGGKTALIDRFCLRRGGSTRVLRGACDALFTPRPLGPIQDFAGEGHTKGRRPATASSRDACPTAATRVPPRGTGRYE